MMRSLSWHVALVLLLSGLSCEGAHVVEGEFDGEGESADYEAGGDEGGARGPSSVFVMEHGFLLGSTTEWMPRGTLLLSGSPGGRGGGNMEARLSDAKEFVQLRPELQGMMTNAVEEKKYYAIRMYRPENPKRVLQASIPAKLLAEHFEDWYDILDVTVGASGVPVSLAYRVRHTLGLALFDHTQVHLSQPGRHEGPRIAPRDKGAVGGPGGAKPEEPAGISSFLRKYWWVILIVMFLLNTSGEDPKGGGGGGGGAKK